MDIAKEILKSIQIMVDKKLDHYKADRTYQSVITEITPKGYVVLDECGGKRTVQCCIPNAGSLKPGQKVWVKEPCGRLNALHIAGIIGKQA